MSQLSIPEGFLYEIIGKLYVRAEALTAKLQMQQGVPPPPPTVLPHAHEDAPTEALEG